MPVSRGWAIPILLDSLDPHTVHDGVYRPDDLHPADRAVSVDHVLEQECAA
jgi:hypothetical protein